MKKLSVITIVLFLSIFFAGTVQAYGLTDAQKSYIDSWLQGSELNQYGDPQGTFYMGGSPLYDEESGQIQDRYEYVIKHHPELMVQIEKIRKEGLASVETQLEMAIKDLHLEMNSDTPDKNKIAELRVRISALQDTIFFITGDKVRNFGILPEVFSEEMDAALESEDYLRIYELLHNLKEKGDDAVKHEAEYLFALNHQLRFCLMNETGHKVSEVRDALNLLSPVLATLKV